ncbi:acyl-CoA/acyl-ACP dehydrogenase, partial [Candidatus Acetothermia bacterium]|nr:acyl-CoA/acyl-ACP dehydrogenase [Candidatus Acetothermia bacterium]
MIDFTPSEETRMIVKGLRSFIEKEVKPIEEKHREYFESEHKRLNEDGSLKPEVKAAIDKV